MHQLSRNPSLRNSRKTGPHSSGLGSLFHLEDVSVQFGNINALSNVQFSVDRGEIVFITGVSGAGKTTLLRVLSGQVEPTSGRVSLPHGPNCFVSNVFQDLRIRENDSCEKNLFRSFDKKVYNSKNDFYSDLIELSRLLGVQDRLHMKMKDANGGLKQKIAFIRALLAKPQVILADEPTSSLDYENAKKMFDILNLYNVKKGLTVIWASHNKDLVKKFTGRIVHLDKGKLIYSGHACFI